MRCASPAKEETRKLTHNRLFGLGITIWLLGSLVFVALGSALLTGPDSEHLTWLLLLLIFPGAWFLTFTIYLFRRAGDRDSAFVGFLSTQLHPHVADAR